MSTLQDKVVLITGGARGQGRSHAIRVAELGAEVVVVDICRDIESIPYALSTRDDLEATVDLVDEAGKKALAIEADIRDEEAMRDAVAQTMSRFGRLDVVVANAGVCPLALEDHPNVFQDTINVNVVGTQNTIRAAMPALIDGDRGGSIIVISSGLGMAGQASHQPGGLAYVASKHAIIGLMRSYANALAPHSIRVNSILPSGIGTPMVMNPALLGFLEANASEHDRRNALPVEMIEEIDISNAVAWLASEEARYVTGIAMPVDAGWLNHS